jgi:hypothetical protein
MITTKNKVVESILVTGVNVFFNNLRIIEEFSPISHNWMDDFTKLTVLTTNFSFTWEHQNTLSEVGTFIP